MAAAQGLYVFAQLQDHSTAGGPRDHAFAGWPFQEILSLIGFCVRLGHPFIAPPACIAQTVAILQYDCAIFDPFRPPVCTPYTIQYCALQYRAKANSQAR